jgi:hypothetical protein
LDETPTHRNIAQARSIRNGEHRRRTLLFIGEDAGAAYDRIRSAAARAATFL